MEKIFNNPENVFNQNELLIFKAIYDKGPISRVRLSELLGLTRASLTISTKKLLHLGLIEEIGKANSIKRGRNEILLSIKEDTGIIISIHISLHYLTLGFVNLKGKIKFKKKILFNNSNPPNKIIELLVKEIKTLININYTISKNIIGISIALPGIIDINKKIARETSLPGWSEFPIGEYIENKLGYKTYIENDVKTITLGELDFGTDHDVRNLICIWIEDGIGSGIIIDGKLLRGINFSAGEIGYSRIINNISSKDSIFINGSQSCWGDVLNTNNIQESIKRGKNLGWESKLNFESTLDDFIQAIKEKDILALHILKLFNQVLAKIIFNLIYTFNPQELLLSGPFFSKIPNIEVDIISYLNKEGCQFRIPLETVKLKISKLGEDGITIGGAAVFMENFFKRL